MSGRMDAGSVDSGVLDAPTQSPPPLPAHPPIAPAKYVFARDVPCIGCGYNLRTMNVSEICPECARKCADSLASLHAGRADQLARIASGLMWMAWPALAFPLVTFALLMIDIWLIESDGPAVSQVAGVGAGIAGPILAWIGVRRARQRAEADERTRGFGPRMLVGELPGAHVAGAIHAGASIVFTVMVMLLVNEVIYVSNEEPMVWFMGSIAATISLSWALRNAMVTRRCAELARRSDAKVMRRVFWGMSGVSWVMAAAVVGIMVFAILVRVFEREMEALVSNNPALVMRVFQGVGIALYIASVATVLVWGLLWPIMLSAMARHLRRASKRMAEGGPVLAIREEEPLGIVA